ncbi:MAG TPA: hypothetical protein VJL61_12245 [Rhodanobacteraceae bacterium]|nr:hypothetical protein [Rhodanobacteraceae bacterium]
MERMPRRGFYPDSTDVLDLFSKKVVGWSMDTLQDRHLVLRAVLMAELR